MRKTRLLIVGSLLFVGMAWILGWSPMLTVHTIAVQGLSPGSSLKNEQIVSDSGIHLGDQMARVNESRVFENLRKFAPIRAIAISRRWPNTLIITIKEKNPIAAVSVGGKFELYDESGAGYAFVDVLPQGLPVISGVETSGIAAAVKIFKELPTDISSRINSLTAKSNDFVQFTVGDTRVTWGSSEEGAVKVKVLRILLRDRPDSQVIDVSAPYAPISR